MRFDQVANGKLFSAILMMVFLIQLSSGITLEPQSTSINSCICETNLVKIIARNPTNNLESVIMSSSGDKPWVIPGPKEFNIGSGGSKEITAFVTPDCFALPGKYSVAVTAKTATSSATSKIGVEVSTCVVMEDIAEISICKGEAFKAKIPIKNIARDEERIYAISLSSKDGSSKAITAPTKMTVGINTQKDLELAVDGKLLNVGNYVAQIKAQALYEATSIPTTDVDTTNLKIEVKNCEAFDLIAPAKADVCAGTPTIIKASLVNSGTPANVRLTTNSQNVKITPDAGLLHEAETAPLEIAINAQAGSQTAKLFAKSDLKSVEKEIEINARECQGVRMDLESDKTICSEDGASFDLVLNNRETPNDYKLSISGIDASLSQNTLSLGKGETKTVKVIIPKDFETGNYNAKISAASKTGTDAIARNFAIDKCFDFRLTGPSVEMCSCEEKQVQYELINFGLKDDMFSLKSESGFVSLKETTAFVKSKEKISLTAKIDTCGLKTLGTAEEKINGVITAKSQSGKSDSLKLDVKVKSVNQCYGIELKPKSTDIHSACEIKSQSVNVINRGSRETAVSLSANLGSKVTPDNLLLQPGESKEVFLVIFPSPSRCGTKFNVEMKAEGRGTTATKGFAIDMDPEEITPVPSATAKATALPSARIGDTIVAQINYTNDTLMIKTLPGTDVLIVGEKTIEAKSNEEGKLDAPLSSGTFLVTLSKSGYKPLTMQVNVTGNQTGIGGFGAQGSMDSLPMLLIAFLIIVAALYFVLKRDGSDEENSQEDESEEFDGDDSEEEDEKPKRGRKKRK
ncbi:hypothetical protein HY989_06685 [Candidatus Micrarchaeota archaeon]|nr:hypothetical protein [Candidatus Micrarchaeota archaeon]